MNMHLHEARIFEKVEMLVTSKTTFFFFSSSSSPYVYYLSKLDNMQDNLRGFKVPAIFFFFPLGLSEVVSFLCFLLSL